MNRFVVLAVVLLLAVPHLANGQAADGPAPPPTTVDASGGGVTVASGVNSLRIGARAIRQEWLDRTMISLGTGAELVWRPIPGPLMLRAGVELRLRLGDDKGIDHSIKGGIKIGEAYGAGFFLEAAHRKGLMSVGDILSGEGSRLELGAGWEW